MASNELVEFIGKLDDNQIVKFSDRAKFKAALNVNPPKAWVKKHPFAKDANHLPIDYLPIDKVESLLDSIFQDWQVEIKEVSQLAQSIIAIVRLHYKDPLSNEWRYHDGVGAVALRTNKGATAADLSEIQSNAVSTGAPSAVSFAIKDAADHLGNLFGKNLNRKDTAGTMDLYGKEAENRAEKELNHKQFAVAQIISKTENIDIVKATAKAHEMTIAELDKFLEENKA